MEQRSDEFFHILDDDSDALEYSTDVLNQYFLTGHLSNVVDEGEEESVNENSLSDNSDCEVGTFSQTIELFVYFILANGTRRGRNSVTKIKSIINKK